MQHHTISGSSASTPRPFTDPIEFLPLALLYLSTLWVALCCTVSPAAAQPQLQGDYESIVVVQPGDCSGCTPAQLNALEEGMELLRHRLKRETWSLEGEVCIASASLARDMAALSFEAYRLGHVSLGRWQDYVKARAIIAGGVSGMTRDMLIDRFRDTALTELIHRIDPQDLPDFSRQLEIYAAAQYSRLFHELARDNWNAQSWQDALLASPVGFNPVVEATLAVDGSVRQRLDQMLLHSNFQHVWQEGQVWHLSNLPGDFEVSTIPSLRDLLREDYEIAISADLDTVMNQGCGLEAATALHLEAVHLTYGYAVRDSISGRSSKADQSQEQEEEPKGEIEDEITVIGQAPNCGCRPPVGTGGGRGDGGHPDPGGGGTGTGGGDGGNILNQPTCSSSHIRRLELQAVFGSLRCLPYQCRIPPANLYAIRTLMGKLPRVCRQSKPSTPSPPPPSPGGPGSTMGRLCKKFCEDRGDEYLGYEVTGGFDVGADLGVGATLVCKCG